MDGGRRLLRSLKEAIASPLPQRAAFAGAADLRHGYDPRAAGSRCARSAPAQDRLRRPLARACARAGGAGAAWSAALFGGCFRLRRAASGGALRGFRGPQWRAARRGRPRAGLRPRCSHHLRATRTHAAAKSWRSPASSERNSLPFLDVRDVRERLKSAAARARGQRAQALSRPLVIDDRRARRPTRCGRRTARSSSFPPTARRSTPFTTSASSTCRFVVGEGANKRVAEFQKILEAAGDLKPRIRAGVLVAERRWTSSSTTAST